MKVLCVNGSEISLFVTKRLIELSGIANEVVTASNGLQALNYYSKLAQTVTAETSYPKLVLLDIHAPKMNGFEFLDNFKKNYLPLFKETRVIINSEFIAPEEYHQAKRYPFIIDFLTSGLSLEYLKNLKFKHSI